MEQSLKLCILKMLDHVTEYEVFHHHHGSAKNNEDTVDLSNSSKMCRSLKHSVTDKPMPDFEY